MMSIPPTKESILGQQIRCTLNDGRIIRGKLVCLDRLRNLVLTGVVEERLVRQIDYCSNSSVEPNKQVVVKRKLSQAMVPGSRLEKVQVEQRSYGQDCN